MVSLEFFTGIILPQLYGPGSNSASNRNEYQEYFLGDKGDRYLGLTTLPLSCADYLAIWETQPPGRLRACKWTAQGLVLFVSTGTHLLVKNNGPQVIIIIIIIYNAIFYIISPWKKMQCWTRIGKLIKCYNEWICMRVGMFKMPSATGCTEDTTAVPWQSFQPISF